MGPVIDDASYKKILGYLDDCDKNGCQFLLDGRSWMTAINGDNGGGGGKWIGPTIVLHSNPNDKTMKEEVFGPVLSVYKCRTPQEAIEIENGT